MNKHFLPLICLFLLTGLILPGCKEDKKPSTVPAAGKIGVSLLDMENPFFQDIASVMKAEGQKRGFTVTVLDGRKSADTQNKQVADFISQGMDVIVLSPCDSRNVKTAIAAANKASKPVFTIDIASQAEGVQVVSHIATDNYQGGRMAAQALIEAMGPEGEAAIIGFPDVESCLERVRGFHDELKAQSASKGVKITIVKELSGKGERAEGEKAMSDILVAHPNIKAVFAINDPSALGAWSALKRAGKDQQIKIIGFDGMPEGKKAIRDGRIYADAVQYQKIMAAKTIEIIAKHLSGEKVDPIYPIPTGIYRKQDADKDPELKD